DLNCGLFAAASITPCIAVAVPPEAMIGAPAIMAPPAAVVPIAMGTPAGVAGPLMVLMIAAAAARSPAVMALAAAMPAILIAAGSNDGRRDLGDLRGRNCGGIGRCCTWRCRKSKCG